jgi:superfamily II DNA/RNA helicase
MLSSRFLEFWLVIHVAVFKQWTQAFLGVLSHRHGIPLRSSFGVDDVLWDGLVSYLNVEGPNSIQAEALPLVMRGKNVTIVAQTGSGKTLIFLLPMLQSLLRLRKSERNLKLPETRVPFAIVLSPTKLLCEQHRRVAEHIISTEVNEILFSTPDDLIDEVRSSRISLDLIKIVALDEVDAILYNKNDDGFTQVASQLMECLPNHQIQFICTTAYLTEAQKVALLHRDFTDMVWIGERVLGRSNVMVPTLRQRFKYFSGNLHDKLMGVIRESQKDDWFRQGLTIIFCPDVDSAESLCRRIATEIGIEVLLLHENMEFNSQNEILIRMQDKSPGKAQKLDGILLVCTEVASRGLDIPNVRHVILQDVPTNISDFLHRAGRTARRGQIGVLTCLVKTGTSDYSRFNHLHALKDASKLSSCVF